MSKRAAPHTGPWVIPGTHSVNPVVFLLCAANMSSVYFCVRPACFQCRVLSSLVQFAFPWLPDL